MHSTFGGGAPAAALPALEEAVWALAGAPVPGSVAALEESDRLLRVRDLVSLAIDQRVGVVDTAGEAKVAGHSSTTAWLRNGSLPAGSPDNGDGLNSAADGAGGDGAGGDGVVDPDGVSGVFGLRRGPVCGGRMGAGAAAAHKRNGRQFVRLPDTVAAVRAGLISHAMGSAIAAAVAVLGDEEQVGVAEKILLRLAGDPQATVEKVSRAGRYLRQVLDPDGHLSEHERAHRNRHLSAHVEDGGGMSGSYYLPPEAAARLQALFDAYARKPEPADGRTQSQRNADVLIQLLTNAVTAELLVIVNADSLTDEQPDSDADEQADADAESGDDGSGEPVGRARPAEPAGCAGPVSRDRSRAGWPASSEAFERIHDIAAGGEVFGGDAPGLMLSTGHPLPAPRVRRLARTSRLYRLILQAPSKILDLGAATRDAPAWMRRGLLATYDTCCYNHCPIPAKWCEIDHIDPWSTHHRTSLDNIAPGCDHHNRDRAKHPDHYRTTHTHDGRWHIISTTHRIRR
ncbi:MAG: DUF222 domain-containing protein [Nocardioidaceae bacterium]